MSSRRIVVTGLGALTPLGNSTKESWLNLINSKSGIVPISSLKNYETDFKPLQKSIPSSLCVGNLKDPSKELQSISELLFTPQDERRMTPMIKNAMLTTFMSLKSSNLVSKSQTIDSNQVALDRISISMGVGLPPIQEIYDASLQFNEGKKRPTPMLIPQILPNMVASSISIKFGLMGPCQTVSSACATGNNAIIDGFNNIKNNLSDIAIVGASETSLHPLVVSGFHRLKSLSITGQSRPFDEERDGFVISEGSATMILEDLDHAIRRGAPILGEMVSFGMSSDAFHITMPRKDSLGVSKAINMSLERGDIAAQDIDIVNAHATSTPIGDKAELNGIISTLLPKERNKPLYLSSNKGSLGHLLGAAGLIESIFTLMSLKENIIPHTLNLKNPILTPNNEMLHLVRDKPVTKENLQYGICNSFGFGGLNTCILFKKYV